MVASVPNVARIVRAMFWRLAVLLVSALGCSTPERANDWDYVYTAILRPNCATAACHSSLAKQSGLDLSTRETAYESLLRRPCGSTDPGTSVAGVNVDPGHPESSALMYWLRGEYNETMPPDFALPADEIEAIEQWIIEGAKCE